MSWKDIGKKFPFFYDLNSRIKAYQLKRGLAEIKQHYEAKARQSGYRYDAMEEIDAFKKRHRIIHPNFAPCAMGDLSIFWVGACQAQDETGFIQSLNRMGNVKVFYNLEGNYGPLGSTSPSSTGMSLSELRSANDQALIKRVDQELNEGSIDVLIGQMWAHLFSMEALKEVQRLGIPVINISMDDRLPDHWATREGTRMGSIGFAPAIDMVLTTVSETCAWYGVEGSPALFWPLASDTDIFSSERDDARDIDVLFIGNCYGIRKKIVLGLERRGVSVSCYGRGWPNGYVNAEQNAALSKRARIILGVGTVGYCHDVYTLKLRDFDALATGALYVTHRNPDLLKLFNEGTEIECYESVDEAYTKIAHYLEHPAERIRIGKAGQTAILNGHTWDQRLSQTFKKIGLIKI